MKMEAIEVENEMVSGLGWGYHNTEDPALP